MDNEDYRDNLADDVTGIIVHCNACEWSQRISFHQLCMDNMVHRAQIYQGVKRRKCPKCNKSLVITKYLFDDSKILENPVRKYSKRREGW